MSDFGKYYSERFRQDLITFFDTIPENSKHHDNYDKETFFIQYERLTRDHNHLNFFKDKTEKTNFGIALFLTILVDEVCFTHYKPHYQEFKNLTAYPKFIGNCPAGCNYHFHPRDLFSAMNYSRNDDQRGSNLDRIDFRDAFVDSIPFMESEVKEFLNQHFQMIDGTEFWQRCYTEFPYTK